MVSGASPYKYGIYESYNWQVFFTLFRVPPSYYALFYTIFILSDIFYFIFSNRPLLFLRVVCFGAFCKGIGDTYENVPIYHGYEVKVKSKHACVGVFQTQH